MKAIRVFSLFVTVVIIVIVIIAIPGTKPGIYTANLKILRIPATDLQQRIRVIDQLAAGRTNNISESEYKLKTAELVKEIDNLRNQIQPVPNPKQVSEDPFLVQKFWIKLAFSVIFCVVALYVILSGKYEDDTKKWAISALTLIAGVWIGTVS
jgi:hypothetical protein